MSLSSLATANLTLAESKGGNHEHPEYIRRAKSMDLYVRGERVVVVDLDGILSNIVTRSERRACQ